MARINWTLQALEDVESICEFISRDAPSYAHIFACDVFDSVERLKEFPGSGRVVPEVDREYIREIILGNYRIIYRIADNAVDILTVYHSARLLDLDLIKGK